MRNQQEAQEHQQLATWLKTNFPKVLFNSDMSGVALSKGSAIKASKLRSNTGFPDVVIYARRKGYGACFIELKRTGESIFRKNGNYCSPHLEQQAKVIESLVENGYFATFAIGLEDAKTKIRNYLKQ